MLEVVNKTIKINKRILIENFHLHLNDKEIVLLGDSGSGKTLLLKQLVKENKNKAYYINNRYKNTQFKEALKYNELDEQQQNIVNFLMKNQKNIKEKIQLLLVVFNNQNDLLIDDLQNILTWEEKEILFNYLKQEKKIFFYVTNNVEDLMFFEYAMILKKKKIVMEGKTKAIFLEEKIMKQLGFGLPFYIDMSLQLKLYGVLDEIAYNKEEMEQLIWKKK